MFVLRFFRTPITKLTLLMLLLFQFQSSRDVLQKQSRDSVQAMKDQVDDIVNILTSVKIQNLFLIKASPR